MELNLLKPRIALNKAFLKVKPNRLEIELFKKNLIRLIDNTDEFESEEFHKNEVSDFLKKTYYGANHFINTKGRNDLVIHNGAGASSSVGVIIEAKKPTNKSEMLRPDNLNNKAFQELVLYYLRERITHNNSEIKHLIATNIYEWYIFDGHVFEKLFAQNKPLVKKFIDFEEGRSGGNKTEFFYKEIAAPAIAAIGHEITFTYFDIREYDKPLRNNNPKDDNQLIALYKLLSPEHLLKLPFANDSNSLDKVFYTELLHVIGLTETKEGGKKLIQRKEKEQRNAGSLIESAIVQLDNLDKISRLDKPSQFGDTYDERLFNVALELSITWVNRILFLKLLEAQLIKYHKGDKQYAFLNIEKIKNLDDLNTLFFQVLAKKTNERNDAVKSLFANVPYLNSSLFEPTDIEHSCLFISQLNEGKLPILSNSVIKDNTGKKRTGELQTVEYIFEFLNAYDFASEGSEEIQEDNKRLINASVLGLIFEKINGYKDGSFFTPGFITMYMCRETIRRAVLQKFNELKGWNCNSIDDLYDKIDDKKEANTIINSLKLCDPAVGSGHFLVSALNEIIAIKSELKILLDRDGKTLRDYHVEVENDELVVTDDDGGLFSYNPTNKESQRVQETLFHEKQTIIENCLFGVDLNPNSVKICRLRLWIELLKNAYYRTSDIVETLHATSLQVNRELETLPNIDINIKCGNSLISRYALDADFKIILKNSNWSIDSYRKAVATYRNAKSKDEKRQMEKLILGIKQEISSEIRRNNPLLTKINKLMNNISNRFNGNFLFEPNEPYNKKEKELEKKRIAEQKKAEEELAIHMKEFDAIKNNKVFENSFEWRFEFPEVLNDEGDFVGFDVVIGNPPYGSIVVDEQKKYIQDNYIFTDYQLDIYMVFFELAERILKSNGGISFIVPNTWLLNLKTPKIRKLLFTKFDLSKINAFEVPVFDEAVVDTLIVLGVKDIYQKGEIGIEIQKRDKSIIYNFIDKLTLNQNYINPVNIYLSETTSKIIKNIGNFPVLENVAKITQGTKPFQVGKGNPKQTEDILKEKPYVKEVKESELFRPLLRGSLMNRYSVLWKENYYISFGDWLAEPRYSANYDAEQKIVIRQTGSGLIATLDSEKFIVRDNLYTIISLNKNYSEEYILALLNSKFLNWYYQNVVNNEVGEALAQVKKGHLSILPIAEPINQSNEILTRKVRQILDLKKQDPTADTTTLETEIDQLVYQLYGLTDEEIKIVEGEK